MTENPYQSEDAKQRYLTFISIVFGVFISVWIIPIQNIVEKYNQENERNHVTAILLQPKDTSPNAQTEVLSHLRKYSNVINIDKAQSTFTIYTLEKQIIKSNNEKISIYSWIIKNQLNTIARGLIMFLILICLWWWYYEFVAVIRPAYKLWMYAYDFSSLGVYAIAFGFWENEFLYTSSVAVATILVFGRCVMVWNVIRNQESVKASEKEIRQEYSGAHILKNIRIFFALLDINKDLYALFVGLTTVFLFGIVGFIVVSILIITDKETTGAFTTLIIYFHTACIIATILAARVKHRENTVKDQPG